MGLRNKYTMYIYFKIQLAEFKVRVYVRRVKGMTL